MTDSARIARANRQAKSRTKTLESRHSEVRSADRGSSRHPFWHSFRIGEALPTPIFVSDLEGEIVFVNRAWREFTGQRPARAGHAIDWLEPVESEDRRVLGAALARACAKPEPFRVEFRLKRADGALRWLRGEAGQVFASDGELIGFACVCNDSTETLRTIEELRNSASELRGRLRAAEEELESVAARDPEPSPREVQARGLTRFEPADGPDLHTQKLETLGILSGVLAHDFNNLLTGILGNAALAKRDVPESSPAAEILGGIERAALRAGELCSQMLAYSSKGRSEVGVIDLNHLIEDMRSLLDLQKVKLSMRLAPGLPKIDGNLSQVRQIVMNLIMNAAESIEHENGSIELTTRTVELDAEAFRHVFRGSKLPPGRFVSLLVSDNGCGMDYQTRSRMFESFFTTKSNGHGLGMAATHWIVLEHNAAISVRSEVELGTTVEVVFPLSQSVQNDQAEHLAGAPGLGTILVIDDEEVVRDTAGRMLEVAGFLVLRACDGVEGVEVFEAHANEIELVLLDLTMPNRAGPETYRKIREIREDVPVVLISGYDEDDVSRYFAGMEVAGFVRKPFTPDSLFEAVNGALGG